MANVSSSNGLEKRPKLRFPGFDEPWRESSFDELGSFYNGLSGKSKDDFGQGSDRFITYMNVYKNTIATPDGCELVLVEDGEHQNRVEYGDILFTQSSETLEEVGLSSVWLHKASPFLNSFCFGFHFAEKGMINPRFIAYSLRTSYMREKIIREGQGATRYNLSSNRLKPIKLVYPSYQEQSRIASLMSDLEKRIEKQQELICTLKKYKRGVFEAVFSLRLRLMPKDEQKEWKVFKLKDFASRITRKNNGATDIPLTISAQYGLIDQRDFFSKVVASADMSGYYLLRKGEYAYNRSTSNEYPFGSIKRLELYNEGAVSTLYLCFSVNENVIISDFAKWYFESSQWYRSVNEICAEGARNHGLLNVPTDGFFNTTHILPTDIKEQIIIAAFLSLIQGKLEKAQTLLDELTRLRNGLMQKLFI